MDIASPLGILLSIVAILGGQVLEGGNVGSLLQFTAMLIVFGGTMGATLLQHSPSIFWQGVKMLKWIFYPPPVSQQQLIEQVIAWSHNARKGGLLSLEAVIDDLSDPFVKRGVQMLVDGAEPDYLRTALEVEISAYEEHHLECAKVWMAAGGYAPTIGILGAVMGLIHVMENLTEPAKLGAGIAVAFVATIYGVGSANILLIPVASKLKSIVAQQVVMREMLIEGLVSIANGENPRMIESKLQGFIV
ncbi:MAG: flagellar motor protein [Burkholderiales bacterium]